MLRTGLQPDPIPIMKPGQSKCAGCSACDKLSAIDKKIATNPHDTQPLLDERRDIFSLVNAQHDPFANIPVEIASRILMFCQPVLPDAYTSRLRYDEAALNCAILTLCHVCHNWRIIAENTSKLWTILCLTITPSNSEQSVGMVDAWLKRSRALPMFIQLDIPQSISQSAPIEAVLRTALSHASRWEVLDLKVPDSYFPIISTFLASQRLDGLEHLKVDCPILVGAGYLTLNASPKRLTSRVGWADHILANWSGLVHTSLTVITTRHLIQFLRDAPQMTSCTITSPIEDDTPTSTIAKSASLRSLTVHGSWMNFWLHLVLPSLERLCIYDSEIGYETLTRFIRWSGCNIRELSLFESFAFVEDVSELLKLTPDLEHLSLRGRILGESFLSEIAAEVSSLKQLLTNLVSLKCITSDEFFDVEGMSALICALTQGRQHSLKSVEIEYSVFGVDEAPGFIHEEAFERLMKIGAEVPVHIKIVDRLGHDLIGSIRDDFI